MPIVTGLRRVAMHLADKLRAFAVSVVGERLVHRHARPAWIGEDDIDAVTHKGLDQHRGPGGRLSFRQDRSFVDGGHVRQLSRSQVDAGKF